MIAVAIFLISLTPNLHAASAPVLMVLQHAGADKLVETKIEAKGGKVLSPDAGKPQQRWVIRAGDVIKSGEQPANRIVSFYKDTGSEGTRLFVVQVRYFQNSEGRWVPKFLLSEEPTMVRRGDRWIPFTTAQGVPNLIAQTGNALPNAEGYYPSLEVGLTTGALAIDLWVVQ
jgi:hypothetical protein